MTPALSADDIKSMIFERPDRALARSIATTGRNEVERQVVELVIAQREIERQIERQERGRLGR